MLTRAIPRVTPKRRNRSQAQLPSCEISRLLSAAVINKGFRELLLSDPARALSQGFCGEEFSLDIDQKALILSIQADSLTEFARQITSAPAKEPARCIGMWVPVNQPAFVLHAR